MKEEYNKLDTKQRNLMEQLDEILEKVDAVRDGKQKAGDLPMGSLVCLRSDLFNYFTDK